MAVLGFDWTQFYDEAEDSQSSASEKAALENGETTIAAVRQHYGLPPLKSGGAEQRMTGRDKATVERG